MLTPGAPAVDFHGRRGAASLTLTTSTAAANFHGRRGAASLTPTTSSWPFARGCSTGSRTLPCTAAWTAPCGPPARTRPPRERAAPDGERRPGPSRVLPLDGRACWPDLSRVLPPGGRGHVHGPGGRRWSPVPECWRCHVPSRGQPPEGHGHRPVPRNNFQYWVVNDALSHRVDIILGASLRPVGRGPMPLGNPAVPCNRKILIFRTATTSLRTPPPHPRLSLAGAGVRAATSLSAPFDAEGFGHPCLRPTDLCDRHPRSAAPPRRACSAPLDWHFLSTARLLS